MVSEKDRCLSSFGLCKFHRSDVSIALFRHFLQETVVSVENAYVLTDKKALHLRALKTFTDDFGKERLNGEEWLVTHAVTETHILNVYEQLVAEVNVITLTSRQYCVILDPVADGKPQLGKKVKDPPLSIRRFFIAFFIDLEISCRRKILLPSTR